MREQATKDSSNPLAEGRPILLLSCDSVFPGVWPTSMPVSFYRTLHSITKYLEYIHWEIYHRNAKSSAEKISC